MTKTMNELMTKALSEVAGNHYLSLQDGEWHYELDANYDDEISDRTMIEILNDEDPEVAFSEKMLEWYEMEGIQVKDDIASDIMKKIKEYEDFVRTDTTEEEIDSFVMDQVYIDYPYDHFMKQRICVNIMMDTGDGNYDFILNKCFPAYQEDEELMINKEASLVWLAKTQGYSRMKLWKALQDGDMADPKGFLESCRVEVANISSHMNTLVFMVKMTVGDLFELNRLIHFQEKNNVDHNRKGSPNCGVIKVSKDTACGLYDPWNGGGSVLEIELEKDISIPTRYIRSALPDGGDGHSIGSVYGLGENGWTDSFKGIFCSNKMKNIM